MIYQLKYPCCTYVDDVIIYRSIISTKDVLQLQLVLEILSKWAKDWLLSSTFNYNQQRLPIISDYHIEGCTINKVDSCKYLGVTISNNLSWSKHIANIMSKAQSVHGILQMNLRQCSASVKAKPYLAFVKPTGGCIVEYASVIWSPYTYNQ